MTLNLIEQMAETVRYVERLEVKAGALESTCDEFSRIIACFVRIQGGLIPGEVWDEVHRQKGFVSCRKKALRDGVEIMTQEPGS